MPKATPCWPHDRDYLDGRTELNIPSSSFLRAYWDTDVLDVNGVAPGTIIGTDDPFTVRFRVELCGALWGCICGTWCFDVGFSAIGENKDFKLSSIVGEDRLQVRDWRGCDTLCIELSVVVPAGSIPADKCSTVYELAAMFELHCCDYHVGLVGYEALEEYQFYFRHS